jgi:hypothetical protein
MALHYRADDEEHLDCDNMLDDHIRTASLGYFDCDGILGTHIADLEWMDVTR